MAHSMTVLSTHPQLLLPESLPAVVPWHDAGHSLCLLVSKELSFLAAHLLETNSTPKVSLLHFHSQLQDSSKNSLVAAVVASWLAGQHFLTVVALPDRAAQHVHY